MSKTKATERILEEYKNGVRYFKDLDLECENFDDQNLEDIVFEHCFLYSSFRRTNLRNARFINGNIKTCDFREADLTNAHFENLVVEQSQFSGARIDGIYFEHNWAYGQNISRSDLEGWLKDLAE